MVVPEILNFIHCLVLKTLCFRGWGRGEPTVISLLDRLTLNHRTWDHSRIFFTLGRQAVCKISVMTMAIYCQNPLKFNMSELVKFSPC